MEILDIIKKLEGTNVPIIMVAAGILFLLLGLSGGISGKIAIPLSRQKWVVVIGIILLSLGVVLSAPELIKSFDTKNNTVAEKEGQQKITEIQIQQTEAEQQAEAERRARISEEQRRVEAERLARIDEQNRLVDREHQARLAEESLRAEEEHLARIDEENRRADVEHQARLAEDRRRVEAERIARIDEERQQAELERRRLVPSTPDLSVSEFNMKPALPIQGQPVTVRIGIYNTGAKVTRRFAVQWWAGENFPKYEKQWIINGLAAKGGRILTHTYRGYRSWYAHIRTKVVIDPQDYVREKNKNNNIFLRTIKVRKR